MHELLLVRDHHAGHVWVRILRLYVGFPLMSTRQALPESNPLTSHLLVDPEDDRGVCHEFLTEAISRFEEDDSIRTAIVGAVEDLSRQLAKMTMNDNYKPYVFVKIHDQFPVLQHHN